MSNPRQPVVSTSQPVSLADAAEEYGVSVKTLRRRIFDGTVRGHRAGQLIRVDLLELQTQLLEIIPSAAL